MAQFIDNLTVEKTFTPTALQYAVTTQPLANSTLPLSVTSASHQFFTGSTSGQIVKLPDATTLIPGWHYELFNQGTTTLAVQDGSGAALFTLGQSSIGFITLQLNGTAAGTWVVYQQFVTGAATGIVNYNVVSSSAFTNAGSADVLITGVSVTPTAGTYFISFNCSTTGTGSGQQMDVTIYKGASAIVDSKRSNVSPAGAHIFQPTTTTVSQFDGATACSVFMNANGNSMTINGRTLFMMRTGN